ncbi:MAG: hypothetical protein KBH29_01310, partial [Lutibacter sp.]|nr:hypothetical protein [Lutibacter sp.]
MQIHSLFVFFTLFLSCTSNSSTVDFQEPEEIVSKEELLIKHYNESVVPLFKSYSNVEIPLEFKIDTTDITINAGASFGYIEVSQGLINLDKKEIQTFVLAHEVAHIVTIKQAKIFNLEGSIPKGTVTNDYKKAEYLADLIAFHLIHTQQLKVSEILINEFNYLDKLLGSE